MVSRKDAQVALELRKRLSIYSGGSSSALLTVAPPSPNHLLTPAMAGSISFVYGSLRNNHLVAMICVSWG